jgi:uncharacterized membrane protein YedE/YeeE
MSIHSKVTQWGNVSRFCVERFGDYSELLATEVAQIRTRLVREVIALVALAVAGLFTLSFVAGQGGGRSPAGRRTSAVSARSQSC